eukprot:CAMPEP_0117677378 /NCGR_PEP_ID=MMETSP0804-20121206/16713_1 /TAXON_ID=1074897 /ORGANISM="Tetraselmis astigmatica, Strain CCMP880" /LENGTH=364 /DNA_ID=CAMNT_0005486657 /DNA_START=254 /DNA_END=1345 /DNA_ORIENTATION=+
MQTAIPPPLLKTIKTVLPRPPAHWVGDGFHVYPVFANKAFTKELSPFLMFDYGAPQFFPPTSKKLGVGEHPHRGFETVTIAFEGEVEHRDSAGNCGVIGPGDVQWMTAGSGVLHEEFHSTEFAKQGGTFEMCQLWVNLPAKHKMTKPRYQGLLNDEIPVAPLREADPSAPERTVPSPEEDGRVRVIAGSFNNVTGPAKTWTQVDMWDILINNTKKEFVLDTVEGNNVIIFVRKGGLVVQGKDLGPQDVAMTSLGGSKVVLKAKQKDTKVLLLAGEPIDEPIAARGPFVMNTPDQIRKAIVDFQNGKFGSSEAGSQPGRGVERKGNDNTSWRVPKAGKSFACPPGSGALDRELDARIHRESWLLA